MPLTLQVRDANRLLPAEDTSRVLEQGTLTIGRGLENDWVLPDPERVISKQHCEIQAEDGGFLLTDTSSNGVFLNGTTTPVGRGKSVPLNDGDQVRISHFEFTVTVTGDAPSLTAHSGGTADAYGADDPPVFSDAPASGDDPLAGILGDDDHSDPFAAPTPQAAPPQLPDDDFLLDTPPETQEDAGSALPLDHVSAGQGLLQVPEPLPEIPSDWDDDLAGGDSGGSSAGAEPVAPWPAENDPFADRGQPAAAEPAIPASPPTAPTPPPAPRPQAPAPAGAVSPQTAVNALKAFLAGAGLEDELEIPEERAEETLKILGTLYRNTVQGLMEVLATRSSIKNEFRLSQTTIQPVENNPLKFSLGVDDAMTALLTKRSRGYMPPVEAIEEAFEDIKAHQVAVLAGMQVALTGLLARFDPKTLEDRLAAEKGIAKLLTGKKARYWDEFTKLYEKLAVEAEDDFHSVFGREFGRAYEEQVRKHGRRGI